MIATPRSPEKLCALPVIDVRQCGSGQGGVDFSSLCRRLPMVERSHTADWMLQIYEPLRKLGERVADWFAPKADAAKRSAGYS
jgi:hypothetical protein